MFDKKKWGKEYYKKNRLKIKKYYKNYSKLYYKKNKDKIKEHHTKNKNRIKELNIIRYKKNKDKILERHRIYRIQNKDKIKEDRRIYKEKNKNKIKETNKEYYKKNKSRICERNKAYINNNIKTVKERASKYYIKNKNKMNEWRKNNPDKARIIRKKQLSKRRLKLKGFIGTKGITKETQLQSWNECEGKCIYCNKLTNQNLPSNNKLQTTYDHIQEVSHLNPSIHLFDPNDIINIVISCRSCNSRRHNKPILEWCESIGFIPQLIKRKLKQQKEQTKLNQ